MEWFNVALAQYMHENPNFLPQPANVPALLLRYHQTQVLTQRPAIAREVQLAYLNHSKPPYTCPKCRKPVSAPPVDCFALKQINQTMAAFGSKGEAGTEALPADMAPWDGFFPRMPQFPEIGL